eukprot:TRINITY_DN100679_c0_g1_i1.p1 TRINITY_DN100679_c0_g1~~TRINITY_DN100679_c0_g1_i1.p1  ORF type:complete len:421 (+),score=77.09 TRINITY_DN100679_c0_g1_i1:120-1382(+)
MWRRGLIFVFALSWLPSATSTATSLPKPSRSSSFLHRRAADLFAIKDDGEDYAERKLRNDLEERTQTRLRRSYQQALEAERAFRSDGSQWHRLRFNSGSGRPKIGHGDFKGSFCKHNGDWKMEWQDEFEGNKLRDDWWRVVVSSPEDRRDVGAPVAGLGATACREASCVAKNVKVENGTLNLISEAAGGNYTTGAVTTQGMHKAWDDSTPYRLCVRAKLPAGGSGVWPAHWMLPENGLWDKRLDDGEVDIMEMTNADGHAYSTYHWMTEKNYTNFSRYHQSLSHETLMPYDFANTWHEFAIERSRDYVRFVVDGLPRQIIHADLTGTEFSHNPFFLVLNTAIGGAAGSPNGHTQMPVTHSIDYVRVVRKVQHNEAADRATQDVFGDAGSSFARDDDKASSRSPARTWDQINKMMGSWRRP